VGTIKARFPDMTRIVEIAAAAFFNQVFRDGIFHAADMHPGNLSFAKMARLRWSISGLWGALTAKVSSYWRKFSGDSYAKIIITSPKSM